MSFEVVQKGKSKLRKKVIGVRNKGLNIGEGILEEFGGKVGGYCVIMFNEDTNEVGIRFTDEPEENAYKISDGRLVGCARFCKDHVDEEKNVEEYKNVDGMLVFSL